MNRKVWAGIVVVLTLCGCGSGPAEPPPTSTAAPTSTDAPTSTATPTSSAAASRAADTEAPAVSVPPAPEATAPAQTIPTEVPPVAAPEPQATVGESPEANLYLETCEQFIAAIDGVAATGAVTREQAASGIADQLQSNANWSTIPADDQQEMLRGLSAAGNGVC